MQPERWMVLNTYAAGIKLYRSSTFAAERAIYYIIVSPSFKNGMGHSTRCQQLPTRAPAL